MRALGRKLRVDPMAIYRHFQDKNAVIDAMVDAALEHLESPPPDTGTPAERLRRYFLDLRKVLAAHPGLALRVWTTIPTLGPHTLEQTEAALALIRELGVDAREATRAFLMLLRFVTGIAAAEEQVLADSESESSWRNGVRAKYASVPQQKYPSVVAMAEEIKGLSFQEEFEFGLDLLLEGTMRSGSQNRGRTRAGEGNESQLSPA
jgi:TetR/AcrR family tetracycline transcriptional repressor